MPGIRNRYFFVTAVTAAAAAAVILLLFLTDTRSCGEGGESSGCESRTPSNFPSAGYISPQARAAVIQLPAAEVVHPYILLSPSATNYTGCIIALRALPAELTPEQFDTLRSVIAVPFDAAMPCTLLEFNGLRNAAAELLLQQPDFPPDLLLDFAGMHEDSTQDEVWRDYCLQMLVTGWQNLAGRGGDDAEEARALSVRVLTDAAGTRSHTWPGTALLGLRIVSESDPDAFPPEKTDRLILDVVFDSSSSESARITALRLAGERRITQARAAADALARDAGAAPVLRLCAVATLGDIGSEGDRSALEAFASGPDPMLSAVAGKALRQLELNSAAGDAGATDL